jgi:hypothetical protein
VAKGRSGIVRGSRKERKSSSDCIERLPQNGIHRFHELGAEFMIA